MRNVQLNAWLDAVSRPTAAAFVGLFVCFALLRSSLVTVLPLAAHEVFGDAQRVSLMYFAVSVFALIGSFGIPLLVHRLRRRTVLTLGAALGVAAPWLMAVGGKWPLIAGMGLHTLAVGTLEVTLSLYVMDHIPRRELNNFEPTRVFFTAGIWTLGPWFGVWLGVNVGAMAPFALASFAAASLLAYFWYLRATDSPAVAPRRKPTPNPLTYMPRFFAQKRLLLAWSLAVGRASWWSMFFIYAPIYVVTAGLGEVFAGAVVSMSTASFFLVPLWSRFARRRGLRLLLIIGYVGTGAATLLVAILMKNAGLGTAALLLAAIMAGVIDAAGNVPFLRAVHPHDRPEMTTAYNTYRGVAQIITPGVFSVLLKLFELPAVFVAGGVTMLALARWCRFLPKRL